MRTVVLLFLGAFLSCACALEGAVKRIPAEMWSIATAGDTSKTTLFSAEELQTLLEKRIGRKLPVVTAKNLPGTPVILLDKCDPSLGNESFTIRRKDNVIRIIGGCPIGTLYGVYEFLQRYCDVWTVAPGVTYAPKGKLAFGEIKELTMRPAIRKRRLYHIGENYTVAFARKIWKEFDVRNRQSITRYLNKDFFPYVSNEFLVSTATGSDCHNFYDYVPPKKYAKTHPEYYSMNPSGVRDYRPNAGGQLCLSNPDVENIVYNHLIESIAKDRAKYKTNYPRIYDFSQLDNTNYICLCAECKKIIARYGDSDGGLMLWFVNKVARRLKKLYPDVLLRTFAYVSTERLPKGIKAEDNVMIQLCDLYSQCNHTLPLTHPVNKKRAELTKGWGKIVKHLMIWDYILQNGNEPVVPVDAIAADVRLFRECNVQWIFMESEIRVNNPSAFEYLKNFVVYQMYFNPDQDLEKLLVVYCKGVFQDAHKEMRAYLELLRNGQKNNPTADMGEWHRRELKHLTLPFLRQCKALVTKARQINKDPKVDRRLLWEQNVLDNALSRQLVAYPKFAEERKAILKNLLENRFKVLRAHGLADYRLKKVETDIRVPIEESMLVFTDIPEELKKLPPGTIRFLGPSRLTSGGRNGQYLKDPDSKMRRVLAWIHNNPSKYKKVFSGCVYDWRWKRAKNIGKHNAPSDEKYHWYKLVRFSMGPSTGFFMMDWHIAIKMDGFFVVSDGVKADEDPNLYDLWVSMKFQGPAYKEGSTKPNAIILERAMLVPVSRKLGNLGPAVPAKKK